MEPEPDITGNVVQAFKDTLGLSDQPVTASDRITPIDRWFGWDKGILASRDDDDPFVDSSDERSYVTVTLAKPLGIEFIENTEDEGGGVVVGEVRTGFSAHASGVVLPGYNLIVANDRPVYGLSFEEAVKPIVDAVGPVKLTFFAGESVYFYGEFKPSREWLAEFLEQLRRPQIAQSSELDPDERPLSINREDDEGQ